MTLTAPVTKFEVVFQNEKVELKYTLPNKRYRKKTSSLKLIEFPKGATVYVGPATFKNQILKVVKADPSFPGLSKIHATAIKILTEESNSERIDLILNTYNTLTNVNKRLATFNPTNQQDFFYLTSIAPLFNLCNCNPRYALFKEAAQELFHSKFVPLLQLPSILQPFFSATPQSFTCSQYIHALEYIANKDMFPSKRALLLSRILPQDLPAFNSESPNEILNLAYLSIQLAEMVKNVHPNMAQYYVNKGQEIWNLLLNDLQTRLATFNPTSMEDFVFLNRIDTMFHRCISDPRFAFFKDKALKFYNFKFIPFLQLSSALLPFFSLPLQRLTSTHFIHALEYIAKTDMIPGKQAFLLSKIPPINIDTFDLESSVEFLNLAYLCKSVAEKIANPQLARHYFNKGREIWNKFISIWKAYVGYKCANIAMKAGKVYQAKVNAIRILERDAIALKPIQQGKKVYALPKLGVVLKQVNLVKLTRMQTIKGLVDHVIPGALMVFSFTKKANLESLRYSDNCSNVEKQHRVRALPEQGSSATKQQKELAEQLPADSKELWDLLLQQDDLSQEVREKTYFVPRVNRSWAWRLVTPGLFEEISDGNKKSVRQLRNLLVQPYEQMELISQIQGTLFQGFLSSRFTDRAQLVWQFLYKLSHSKVNDVGIKCTLSDGRLFDSKDYTEVIRTYTFSYLDRVKVSLDTLAIDYASGAVTRETPFTIHYHSKEKKGTIRQCEIPLKGRKIFLQSILESKADFIFFDYDQFLGPHRGVTGSFNWTMPFNLRLNRIIQNLNTTLILEAKAWALGFHDPRYRLEPRVTKEFKRIAQQLLSSGALKAKTKEELHIKYVKQISNLSNHYEFWDSFSTHLGFPYLDKVSNAIHHDHQKDRYGDVIKPFNPYTHRLYPGENLDLLINYFEIDIKHFNQYRVKVLNELKVKAQLSQRTFVNLDTDRAQRLREKISGYLFEIFSAFHLHSIPKSAWQEITLPSSVVTQSTPNLLQTSKGSSISTLSPTPQKALLPPQAQKENFDEKEVPSLVQKGQVQQNGAGPEFKLYSVKFDRKGIIRLPPKTMTAETQKTQKTLNVVNKSKVGNKSSVKK